MLVLRGLVEGDVLRRVIHAALQDLSALDESELLFPPYSVKLVRSGFLRIFFSGAGLAESMRSHSCDVWTWWCCLRCYCWLGSREEARALEQAHQAVRLENLLDTPTCSASRELVLPQLECWGLDTLPVAAATLPLNDGLGLGRRLASAGLQPGNFVLACSGTRTSGAPRTLDLHTFVLRAVPQELWPSEIRECREAQ